MEIPISLLHFDISIIISTSENDEAYGKIYFVAAVYGN
jgi:hypothetical protein